MKRKNWLWVVLIIVVLLIGFQLFNNKQKINEKNQPDTENPADVRIPVVADTVKLHSQNEGLKKTGNLIPFKEAVIFAPAAGNIEQLNFELGSKVTQGQVLAVTDTRKLQLDLQNALATERKLSSDVKTYIELLEGKATTQEKLNQLRLDYTDARNQTAQIRKQLNDTRVLAPISGTVTEKTVEKGVFVPSGTKLGSVVNLSSAKVQAFLTETEVYQVKANDKVQVSADVYPDKKFAGTISYISPQADATHSYLVEIVIENTIDAPLRSGTFVYVTFSRNETAPALFIPREALLENAQEPTVYIISNGKAVQRKVRTGRDSGGLVEVLSGLKEGEVVIKSGQINLKDQSLVTISNKNAK